MTVNPKDKMYIWKNVFASDNSAVTLLNIKRIPTIFGIFQRQ